MKNRKPAATSTLNRSRRLCERFCEFKEAGRTVLWSRKEKQIRLKVEEGKKYFSLPFFSFYDLKHKGAALSAKHMAQMESQGLQAQWAYAPHDT